MTCPNHLESWTNILHYHCSPWMAYGLYYRLDQPELYHTEPGFCEI